MTPAEWQAEVCRRIGINEGTRSTMYYDTMGIPTIGIGFNLKRDDAPHLIAKIGANYHAVMGGASLSNKQIEQLFDFSFVNIIGQARLSLSHYDQLSDARRFVICDLVYNMGFEGWMQFTGTRALINGAGATSNADTRHALFGEAAEHLQNSAWYGQVGQRAVNDCAMIRNSDWV